MNVLDITINNLMVRFQWCWWLCGMWSTPSMPLLPGPFLPGVVATYIYGLNRTKVFFKYRTVLTFNCVKTKSVLILCWISWIRLNWIAWNRNVFHLNCVLILNWIVWNRTIYIKMDLALNNLQKLICHKIQPTNQSSTCIHGWNIQYTYKHTYV